tara:strand:+ start:229 stop:408 length:180 start_codon:yes stop_codon:yes gene_type:complete
MEILSDCQANYDATGASITATVFLSVFVFLLVGDGLLTGLALRSAIMPDATPVRSEVRV